MAFSTGSRTTRVDEILTQVTEIDILSYYLNVKEVPCVINSPIREDKNPSLGLYSTDGTKIHYIDFSTGESGGTFDLLSKMWGMKFKDVLLHIEKDLCHFTVNNNIRKSNPCLVRNISNYKNESKLLCKTRDWETYDIIYWEQFGITLQWLKYAEVYPISHKIIIKRGNKFVLGADKYAYVFVEHKEDKVTLKIYQPFNSKGFKWCNSHDKSVIGLWTKVPKNGDNICICSSLKDALCLWANTGIPSVYIQGEGYKISNTAITELKKRFKTIFICLDNDKPGLIDAERLAKETGFINVVLPQFEGGKDIAEYFVFLQNKEKFKTNLINLFNNHLII
jgi:hypothetical protein